MQSGTPQPIPSRVGKYEILRKIADGGMAEVFLGRIAQQSGFEKLVAIKRILPQLAEEKTFVEMFLDEARIAALLNHSNIAQIYDLGTSESGYFIAMEYVRGVPLSTLNQHFSARQQRPAPALAAYLLANVCAGLEYAHTCCDNNGGHLNIVHRDVSPTNILISAEGTVKLIDFGIAKAAQRLQQTQAGKIKGKFGYMSPEQVRTGKIDQRSDIFSSGMVLYELLTGDNPFCGANTADSFERARRAYIPPPRSVSPEVPAELEAICLRALAIKLEERYQSAREMELDLEQFRRQHPYSRLELAALIKETFPEELSSPNGQRAPLSRPLASEPSNRLATTEVSSPDAGRWGAPTEILKGQGSEQASGSHDRETSPWPRINPAELVRPGPLAQPLPAAEATMLLPLNEEAPAEEERTTERPSPAPPPPRLTASQPLRYRAVLAGFVGVMLLSLTGYLIWTFQRLPAESPPALPIIEPLVEDARVQSIGVRPLPDAGPVSDARPTLPDASAALADSAPAGPLLPPDLSNWSTYHHRPRRNTARRPAGEARPAQKKPRGKGPPSRRPRRSPKKVDPKAPPIPFDGL